MTRAQTTRILIEVTAGLIPGQPEADYTRRYVITDAEWAEAQAAGVDAVGGLLAEHNGRAQGYAALLMMQPDRVNFVRTEWLYF